ncbi:T9SS type A sorting domain-containing protein [Lutimonas sp.]|uniref:T9SS type A sorting domain-containing protein n=1 Tax=Lutimonas sp. TaxID=1872403 RepID=UPI003D9AD366
MKSKLLSLTFFRTFILSICFMLTSIHGFAQELYVGPNAEFYISNGSVFTTSNTVVQVDDAGVFSVDVGNTWGSNQEYVDGQVKAYGTGITILPTGNNGVYAPVTMDHDTEATALYVNQAPSDGTNGTDVDAVSTVEYWQVTGTGIATLPWNENSDITNLVNNNGGALSAVAIVGLNAGVWDLVSASHTYTVAGDLLNGTVTSDLNVPVNFDGFSEFTFGIDHQTVLSVDDLFIQTGLSLVSNPVRSYESEIRFLSETELIDLKVSIFDINGRMVKTYDQFRASPGEGALPKSNLKTGLYFVKFEHEGKQGVKKLLIE